MFIVTIQTTGKKQKYNCLLPPVSALPFLRSRQRLQFGMCILLYKLSMQNVYTAIKTDTHVFFYNLLFLKIQLHTRSYSFLLPYVIGLWV